MSKIDPLLKTLQVRPLPPEALVQAYLIHIGDKSDTNFRKIMDLKGIRRSEQSQLLDLFAVHRESPNYKELVQSSALLTNLNVSSSSHMGSGIGSLGSASSIATPSLAGGRFDPAGFGNALINAAKDGVDRFGSPTLGGGSTGGAGSGMGDGAAGAQGEESKGNLNENLKNIGKFFKREGGFRAFGRSEDAK